MKAIQGQINFAWFILLRLCFHGWTAVLYSRCIIRPSYAYLDWKWGGSYKEDTALIRRPCMDVGSTLIPSYSDYVRMMWKSNSFCKKTPFLPGSSTPHLCLIYRYNPVPFPPAVRHHALENYRFPKVHGSTLYIYVTHTLRSFKTDKGANWKTDLLFTCSSNSMMPPCVCCRNAFKVFSLLLESKSHDKDFLTDEQNATIYLNSKNTINR